MVKPASQSSDLLATPVQFLKGVGPDRAELLQKLGLKTAQDLLFFFPRDYQVLENRSDLTSLEEKVPASVFGTVAEIEQRTSRSGHHSLGVLVSVGHDFLRALWFNQPFMRKQFYEGQRLMLSGKPKRNGIRWEMVHPLVQEFGNEEASTDAEIVPVYRLTEGLRQSRIRTIVQTALAHAVAVVPEILPESFRQQHGLARIDWALTQIHNPGSQEDLRQARYRLAFQELLQLQLAVLFHRLQTRRDYPAPTLTVDARIDARIRRLFDFAFTAGQEQAIREVTYDMGQAVAMNRLLQGDVGSGKTVVAIYAMLLAVAHGQQAALMAPTEILARQHFQFLSKVLANAHVRVGLLVGSLSADERRLLMDEASHGQIDLLIGTHALIHAQIPLPRVGLLIVDEQHKFGVRQRWQLRAENPSAHCLVMTATPIPRTIAMTAFGDLDVTILREFPPGRQPVHTYLGQMDQRDPWWEFFAKKLREGRQGYVIVPVVEQSESQEDLVSLQQSFESLVNGPLEAFRVDLIHGGMDHRDKQTVMERFHSGETQVLVATSMVEVGVDVPNASLMTIENAERFGLAQLHQLRGRIGRGVYPGFVCAFSDPKSDDARQRLTAFQESNDGFALAETDFRLRGPGDLFGTKQHGLPPLRVADLRSDEQIVQQARAAAEQLLEQVPDLDHPDYQELRHRVLRRYGQQLEISDVG